MSSARRGAASTLAAIVVGKRDAIFFDTFAVERGTSRALLADRRVLITTTIVDDEGATVRVVCAEPGPDAVTLFGASLAAARALATREQVSVSGGCGRRQQATAVATSRAAAATGKALLRHPA